jgi:hypothetical protein
MAKHAKRSEAGGATKPGKALALVSPPERWKEDPDEHDYPAAKDYLTLLLDDAAAERAVVLLENAPLVRRKAKDLLRSSRLALLPVDDPAVARDLAKVHAGHRLSPVLAIRGRLGTDMPLTVADGYHRICASYHLDEDADIPVRLADTSRR